MKPDLPGSIRGPWRSFLETYEPLRPDLFRYCRHLTHSPWDAEDLAQDVLARAFVTLAQLPEPPPNPRAWLLRVASNLWTDRMRRRRPPPAAADEPATSDDPRATREAAGTLVGRLSPQERAAVVLKDVFELSLEEVAEALSTTVGAVKAALHRARGKLVGPAEEPPAAPPPAVLDAFCAAFQARDLQGLTGLLLDTAAVEVVGATVEYGPERARQTVLWGMLFGVERMVAEDGPIDPHYTRLLLARPPRVEPRAHRGEWLLVHWYEHDDGDAVRALTRLEVDGDRVARLRNYFYSPEPVAEICAELNLPQRSNGRRWWR